MMSLVIILVVAIAILCFRLYRLIHFYIESNNNPDEEERKIAHKNYIIHLIFFLFVLGFAIVIAYNLFVLNKRP